MASLITLSHNFIFSTHKTPLLNPARQHHFHLVVCNNALPQKFASLGTSCFFPNRRVSGTCRVWGSEGDSDLEAEVLEFMKKSKNPNLFPTKEELFEAGRIDLLRSIAKQGGWMSLGWDLDDEEEQEGGFSISDNGRDGEVGDALVGSDSRMLQDRFDDGGVGGCDYLTRIEAGDDSLSTSSSWYSPSSYGRMESEEDAGIEGILRRLEKERTQSYGVDSKDKQSERAQSFGVESKDKQSAVHGSWNDNKEDLKMKIPEVIEGDSIQCLYNCDESRNSLTPDMWRKWSNMRAGIPNDEFEAAEFGEVVNRNDDIVLDTSSGDKEEETVNDYSWIRSRLQHMGSELESALQLLRCNIDLAVSDKGLNISSQESLSLSDAWEFRETEIIKARDKLRSLRAQFAILEGQMALKIIEAQKLIDMKQKKIHAAEKALNSLRTACVIWHKPASEVLLVGSFDGWTNQRRMELSSPGIFSLYLKLYPGRYEIKFIVDGMWMIDPLRPVVNSDGHQNNLLIIS